MDNGCPKCEKIAKEHEEKYGTYYAFPSASTLCLGCQLEQADADVLKAMNRQAELKKKKEKENAVPNKQR